MAQIPIALDSWQLIDTTIGCGDQSSQNWHFDIRDGNVVLLNHIQGRPYRTGIFLLRIMWPKRATTITPGFAILAHPTWGTLPRIIPLAGIPTPLPQDRDWRFICPIKRTFEQILFLDSESMLFVSRQALGRRQRRSDFARIQRAAVQILRLEHEYGALDENPPDMSPWLFDLLKEAREALYLELNLAACSVPEHVLDDNGLRRMIAMSRMRSTKRAARPGRTYYLDKSGSPKMSPILKKSLGIY
ncbi:hypothetical protein V4R08_01325 [Nitrobacter sp. NHB1]|uniref:hypothetical protein n=1 Tax=Nitrobacter sp. NHB1 TaxID=3119830 RepID=UPI002FFFA0D9